MGVRLVRPRAMANLEGARGHLVDLQAVPEQDARLGQVVAPDRLLRAAEQRDDLLPLGGGAR